MIGKRGIFFITLSPTFDVMKNMVALIFNHVEQKANNFPEIGKVTFLVPKGMNGIKIGGKMLSQLEACTEVLRENNIEDVQIRVQPVYDYTRDIPEVITDAENEVGKDNIIIDLTSGKKDITGSLYTAATISDIRNIIYVDVHKAETKDELGRQKFYILEKDDPDIMQKLDITIFETMNEFSDLASLNCIDFIIYKKTIEDLSCKIDNAKLDMYFSQMNKAVDAYFDQKNENYDNCIRDIGMINADLTERLIRYLKKEYKDIFGENEGKYRKKGLEVIMFLEDKYQKDGSPESLKSADQRKRDEVAHLTKVFGEIPALCDMLNIIRIYRNHSSHSGHRKINREDAKIVLELIIKLFTDLNKAGILDDVFSEIGEGL